MVYVVTVKVEEDLSYVVTLRKKLSYIESIPGVLLPHPSSSAFPYTTPEAAAAATAWPFQQQPQPQDQYYSTDHHLQHFISDNQNNMNNYHQQQPLITPSMSSLEALLSKLPPVIPPPQLHSSPYPYDHHHIFPSSPQMNSHDQFTSTRPPLSMEKIMLKEENEEEDQEDYEGSGATYTHHQQQPYFQH